MRGARETATGTVGTVVARTTSMLFTLTRWTLIVSLGLMACSSAKPDESSDELSGALGSSPAARPTHDQVAQAYSAAKDNELQWMTRDQLAQVVLPSADALNDASSARIARVQPTASYAVWTAPSLPMKLVLVAVRFHCSADGADVWVDTVYSSDGARFDQVFGDSAEGVDKQWTAGPSTLRDFFAAHCDL